jgi:hypothetical protein
MSVQRTLPRDENRVILGVYPQAPRPVGLFLESVTVANGTTTSDQNIQTPVLALGAIIPRKWAVWIRPCRIHTAPP